MFVVKYLCQMKGNAVHCANFGFITAGFHWWNLLTMLRSPCSSVAKYRSNAEAMFEEFGNLERKG